MRNEFQMTSSDIARVMGTVGSPLIVISELIKNAVDATAKQIDIFYNRSEKSIIVENDNAGFLIEDIELLSKPAISSKKIHENYRNGNGLFYTGSKGLGLISVFLVCEKAEILTTATDGLLHRIVLTKSDGTVEDIIIDEHPSSKYTRVTMFDVAPAIISHLSSDAEVRKLRHICTYLYKGSNVIFPAIILHIEGQPTESINFEIELPEALYDARFSFDKESGELTFSISSSSSDVICVKVVLSDFSIDSLRSIMLEQFRVKTTISTRSNEQPNLYDDYGDVPSFEGRILVYEKKMAGSQLKAYGAGVNIYVSEFALYNYLAEENDWLGLADFSQRKKATRLKPHNVFGFVNFPDFDEGKESLLISNERADFIQSITYLKFMYLLKGVILYFMFNIDVAEKNPKNKEDSEDWGEGSEEYKQRDQKSTNQDNNDNITENENAEHCGDKEGKEEGFDRSDEKKQEKNREDNSVDKGPFRPRKKQQGLLQFNQTEGQIIQSLRNKDDRGNKICAIVFELSKLDVDSYKYAATFLYRSLLEAATKEAISHNDNIKYKPDSLSGSMSAVLNWWGPIVKSDTMIKSIPYITSKTIGQWRDMLNRSHIVDRLNEYIHNETPVDSYFIQESWNTMKGYIIACLSIKPSD